ncbi:MAG: hypothetical protein EP319_00080 [Deltaproteobacteria bacterium]|nr:MAG: hypothetical protein EP319_00080 [Deltaproteobacteria bacterium]
MSTCTDTFLCKETSFYILGSSVFYNQEGEGIPHPDLWEKVVEKFFTNLAYENRKELKLRSYGAERGRIVHKEDGSWAFYGTPGLEKWSHELVSLFGLDEAKYVIDLRTDNHYKTIPEDVDTVKDCLKLIGSKIDDEKLTLIEVKI